MGALLNQAASCLEQVSGYMMAIYNNKASWVRLEMIPNETKQGQPKKERGKVNQNNYHGLHHGMEKKTILINKF